MAIYPLPQDTLRAFQEGQVSCHNLGLLFDRYTPFGHDWTLEGSDKYHALDSIVKTAGRAQRDTGYQQLVQQHCRRWHEGVKSAGAPDDCIFEAQPEWRLAVGLGRDSALEVGFAFHHVYGFPYLPGSALKGLTQAWALWQVAERLGVPALLPGQTRVRSTPIQQLEALLLEPETEQRHKLFAELRGDDWIPVKARLKSIEADKLSAELQSDSLHYQQVFGTVGTRGGAIFFDAVPIEPVALTIDVMNPHYADYYQQKAGVPPADYLSPVPIYFLTVRSGSRFAFAVAAGDQDLARLACGWLKNALVNMGAGAKTSAGYGYWSEAIPLGPIEPEVPSDYQRGRVLRFGLGVHRSFGFIAPAGGGPDIFVHKSGLAKGVETLTEGQEVVFKTVQTPDGRQAEDVRPV